METLIGRTPNNESVLYTTDWKNNNDERLTGVIVRKDGIPNKFFEIGFYTLNVELSR